MKIELIGGCSESELEGRIKKVAAAGKLSRFPGNVFEVIDSCDDYENNLKLVKRIIKMGHKSIIEHDYLVFALNDVTPIVEQTIIGYRLTSFTIKSRREVDFSNVGYYVPEFKDVDGTTRNEFVEGNEVNARLFEERFAQLKETYKKELDAINSQDLEPEVRSQKIEDLACEFYGNTCQIERECGVSASVLTKEALGEANYRVQENEKTQIKEGIKDAAGFAAGVALGAITAGVDLLPKKDDGTERYLGDTQENKYFS